MRQPSKALLLLVLAVAFTVPAAAQYTTPIAQSARSGALGGSFLYDVTCNGVTLDYRSGYLLAAMADKTVRMQVAAGTHGTALVTYSHHGDASWHEQQAALAYGMQATPWLHAAVAARWLQRGTCDVHYERHQWLAPSALLQLSLGRTTWTMLGGTRPWDDRRPWRWHLQGAYRPFPQWLAIVEVEAEVRTRLRLGMEYSYGGVWYLRAGMATRPVVMTCGIGARCRYGSIDFAVEVHEALGITPQTSLSLWF